MSDAFTIALTTIEALRAENAELREKERVAREQSTADNGFAHYQTEKNTKLSHRVFILEGRLWRLRTALSYKGIDMDAMEREMDEKQCYEDMARGVVKG